MLSPMNSLLLGLCGGLSNQVAPSLRAVVVDIDEARKILCFFFFYDGKITDELFDFATVATAETETTLLDYTDEDQIIQLDYPEEIPIRGKVAYYRYEPHLPKFPKENRAHLLKDLKMRPVIVLVLNMQEALLGKVTPNLRLVSVKVEEEQKLLKFYFVYDGGISEKNTQMANEAIQEASVPFTGFKIEKRIERMDYSKSITCEDFSCVYLRYENLEGLV